jgi:hypothetical protein
MKVLGFILAFILIAGTAFGIPQYQEAVPTTASWSNVTASQYVVGINWPASTSNIIIYNSDNKDQIAVNLDAPSMATGTSWNYVIIPAGSTLTLDYLTSNIAICGDGREDALVYVYVTFERE